ncbi:MAG: NAD(P)/FAD-dependent oxidoreductase [Desulfobaccales bacterium]
MADQYDLLVIGTGPAGLTAALYGRRLGLDVVVLGDTPGGNVVNIESVQNYPGFMGGVSGAQLGTMIFAQVQAEGANLPMTRLDKLTYEDQEFIGTSITGEVYRAPAAILACGVAPKRLDIPNSDKPGIYYCSLCDGPLFRNRNASLAIIGGGNMAAHEALTLAKFAQRLIIIHRGDNLRAEAALANAIAAKANIEVLLNAQVVAFRAHEQIDGITVNLPGQENIDIPVDGVFLAIGWGADLGVIQVPVATTAEGFLKTDDKLMTSLPGLFAAGDVRDTDMRQIVTAVADGARAATYAQEFITENFKKTCGCKPPSFKVK